MKTTKHKALFAAITKLLRPLVRILLRNGIPYGTFADLAKQVYVDVALHDFTVPGRKPTNSRAAIITGLSRKEVLRVRRLKRTEDTASINRYNRAARVISGWVRSPRFADSTGQPAALPFENGTADFSALVKEFSGDVPARAILDELLATGSVEQRTNGEIVLCARAYIPDGDENTGLAILGSDVADLIHTIDHNLAVKKPPLFQRKVSYDNVPEEAVAAFRQLSSHEGQKLLERLDHWLSAHDRDNDSSVQGTGRKRLGMAVYYFEEDSSNPIQPEN